MSLVAYSASSTSVGLSEFPPKPNEYTRPVSPRIVASLPCIVSGYGLSLPEGPLRTLQRHVQAWRVRHDPGRRSCFHNSHVLGRLTAVAAPEQVETALQLKERPLADTGRYDRLRDSAEDINHARYRG